MRHATSAQIRDLAVRMMYLRTDRVDGDAVTRALHGRPNDEIERRLTAFVNNGLSFEVRGPGLFTVDRSKPFDIKRFYEGRYPIWCGPKDGDGLEGEEEQDARSLQRTEFDFANALFSNCFENKEEELSAEERIARHWTMNHICVDAQVGQALVDEEDQMTLRWLRRYLGVHSVMILGTVFRGHGGSRHFMWISTCGGDRWGTYVQYCGEKRNKYWISAALLG